MNSPLQQLRTLARQFGAELEANRRLATLLLLVPGVLLVYLALLAGDAVQAARADNAALARRTARLEALASAGDWGERVAAERLRLAQWEQQLWRAASPELAAADLQTAVQRLSAEHLTWNRLKLAAVEPVAAVGGWRIKAELNGKLKDGGVLVLLQALAEHEPRIRIDRLNVAQQRGQTLSLQLSVLVAPGESKP